MVSVLHMEFIICLMRPALHRQQNVCHRLCVIGRAISRAYQRCIGSNGFSCLSAYLPALSSSSIPASCIDSQPFAKVQPVQTNMLLLICWQHLTDAQCRSIGKFTHDFNIITCPCLESQIHAHAEEHVVTTCLNIFEWSSLSNDGRVCDFVRRSSSWVSSELNSNFCLL